MFGHRSEEAQAKRKRVAKKKDEKPFLLFDPLLDKAPADNKAQSKSRAATRIQMEERMRGRSAAKTAYSKANRRVTGPALGFSTLSSTGSARKRKSRDSEKA